MFKHLTAVAALATAGFVASIAHAQDYTLKYSFADVDSPATNAAAAHAYVFKATLERLTGGRMAVDIYPNGQLGDAKSMAQQIRRGTIDVASFSSGVFASAYYPQLGIFDLPFLFTTRDEIVEALDPSSDYIAGMLDEVAETTGVRVLSFEPYGFRNFTTASTPIKSPADMQGLKMRTQEIVPHQRMMEALGASPTPIPFMELYSALQTGVVDGQENPLATIQQQKFSQVQKNLTLSGHLMTVAGIFVNEEWYQDLPEDLRAAVIEANAEASLAYAGIGAVQDVLALGQLEEEGMEVTALTADELQAFRDATIAPVREWAGSEYGEDFVDGFFAHLDSLN